MVRIHVQLIIKMAVALVTVAYIDVRADEIKVVVASMNQYKIEAVRAAYMQKFPDDTLVIIGYPAQSNIAAQPVGKENARLGAKNRIQDIPVTLMRDADYCVALENYIELDTSSLWFDKGYVIVIDMHTQSEVEASTAPTYIPERYMQLLQETAVLQLTGYSITAGAVIQASVPYAIDHHDWQAAQEFGGVSRQTLLQAAVSKALHADDIAAIKAELRYYQDFPKAGVFFVDFFPVLRNPRTLHICIELLHKRYAYQQIDVIVGLEARGFLLGGMLAARLGVGFVPVRKPGKMPGASYSYTYQKEYGQDTLTLAHDSLQAGQRVLIVDDLIATGNSARAAIALVKQAGACPIEFVSLLREDRFAHQAQLEIPTFTLID